MVKNYILILLFGFLQNLHAQELNAFDIARKGIAADFEMLCKTNPESVNAIDANGFSPLILACYRANTPVVNFLISHKCNVNYVSTEGTALMATTVKGNASLTSLLLENGANPDLTNSAGTTALMYAAQFKNAELVQLLLKYKANKSLKNKEGKTAFEYAVFSNDQTIINALK